MGRYLAVLLIILLTLFAAIAGRDSRLDLSRQDGPADTAAASLALPFETVKIQIPGLSMSQATLSRNNGRTNQVTVFHSSSQDLPRSNSFITDFLFEGSRQPCWLSLAQSQGQSLILNRVSPENKVSHASNHKYIRNYQPSEIETSLICSRHLLESSPPGFFLLI